MDSLIEIPDTLPSLLEVDEAPPFELILPRTTSPLLILCDHARKTTPRCLGLMGLAQSDFEKHIAYDIGGEDVARELARLFDCSLFIAGYSRLVIDLNRHPGDGSSIPEVSGDIEVPANRGLSPEEITRRANTFFWPYHNAVTEQLQRLGENMAMPVVVSIHSFTPEYRGHARPWHVGVLWDQDQRISQPLLERLRSEPGLCIGDNEPYHARNPLGFTMDVHCERNGYPHVLLEIRQDLINDKEKAHCWASLLHRHLSGVFEQEGLLAQA
jgi:predicted N-formylglutamate amidohydrolase